MDGRRGDRFGACLRAFSVADVCKWSWGGMEGGRLVGRWVEGGSVCWGGLSGCVAGRMGIMG